MAGRTWLAYQYDFRPLHVGIQMLQAGRLDEQSAAMVTFAVADAEGDPAEQRRIITAALNNPQDMMAIISGQRG